MNNKCTIVMYHYVRPLKHSKYPKIKGLDYALFKQQIRFFKHNYTIISIDQLLKATTDKSYTLPENSLLLTFDDGYIDHFEYVFPILKQENLKACFSMPAKILKDSQVLDVNKIHFILASSNIDILLNHLFSRLNFFRGNEFCYPSNEQLYKSFAVPMRFDNKDVAFIKKILQHYLPSELRKIIINELFKEYVSVSESNFSKELYLSKDHIKLMKKSGMHLGIHGFDHLWLGKIKFEEAKNDIMDALNFFHNIIDKNSWSLLYPYGSYNLELVEFVKNHGCTLGFTTIPDVADLSEHDPLLLPRLDTNDFYPLI